MSADRAGLIAAELRTVLAQLTGRAEFNCLSGAEPLLRGGAGLDSLTGMLLLRHIQRVYGVDVAAEDLNLDSLATLHTLADFIAARSD